MHRLKRTNDSVHWYMNDLSSRIIAESGIPTDRFHLGKLILQGLKDAPPDFISQIDGATDESETNASVLERSVKCATCFRNLGLQKGDVMVLMAPSHLDLTIPFYAALYLGIIIAAVDWTLTVSELQTAFHVDKPKIIFCQSERASDVQLALKELDLDGQIITFDKGDYVCSFSEFLRKYGDDSPIEDFRAENFDPEGTVAFLIATSGTTGLPKSVAATQKNLSVTLPYWWSQFTTFPSPTRMALIGSPLQWLTAMAHFSLSAIMRYTRLQSSLPLTQDHAYRIINTYKPTFTVISPTLLTSLIKPSERDKCDFSCFELIFIGGSAVSLELIEEMKLINVDTKEDIVDPNIQGELWIKGPAIFKEYYGDPVATEETFTQDRWFKTGDIFYRDENWYFYFVDRYKLRLKYTSHQISPGELEGVIRQHPGVYDVAVTGIPDPERGDLAVACVVLHPGYDVTAQEIKDLVSESPTDSKKLRGGVIFMNEIPMTASTKIHRRKLKEMVLTMKKE